MARTETSSDDHGDFRGNPVDAVRPRRAGSGIPTPGDRRGFNTSRSRTVGLLKWMLPLIAVLLVTLVVAWPYLSPDDRAFRLGFAVLETKDTEDPSMVNARFYGNDDEGRPYSVTADFARNLTADTHKVELERPKADIALKDDTWLVLTADSGTFLRLDKMLALEGGVNLFHDTGYEFSTSVALVDLTEGTASSDQPVAGHGPFGTLTAQGFVIRTNSNTLTFDGRSHLVLYPGPDQGRERGRGESKRGGLR